MTVDRMGIRYRCLTHTTHPKCRGRQIHSTYRGTRRQENFSFSTASRRTQRILKRILLLIPVGKWPGEIHNQPWALAQFGDIRSHRLWVRGIPRFIALSRSCIFYKSKVRSIHQQKDYNSLKAQKMISIF